MLPALLQGRVVLLETAENQSVRGSFGGDLGEVQFIGSDSEVSLISDTLSSPDLMVMMTSQGDKTTGQAGDQNFAAMLQAITAMTRSMAAQAANNDRVTQSTTTQAANTDRNMDRLISQMQKNQTHCEKGVFRQMSESDNTEGYFTRFEVILRRRGAQGQVAGQFIGQHTPDAQ